MTLRDARWRKRLRAFLSPHMDEAVLQEELGRLRQGLPSPVIWLFGKVQAGKSSIIRALTGAESVQIGAGFSPCTRRPQRYDFPSPECPLAVFLDTRGLGEAGYDPREDVAACHTQANMLLVVVKAMDMALEQLLDSLYAIVQARSDWPIPIIVAQTTLHEGYSPDVQDHVQPYPFGVEPVTASIPGDLARALAFQRGLFADIPVTCFVPVDFTLAADGFPDTLYGREALLDAVTEAHPHAAYHTLRQLPELTQELKSVHFRRAQPHLIAYAAAAAAAGATPLPLADLPFISALQLKLLHTIASIYRQPLAVKTFLEVGSTVGVGLLFRLGARSLLKVIPGLGSAVSGLYAGAATYALGRALCYYYQTVFEGHMLRPEQLRVFYQAQFAEGMRLLQTGEPGTQRSQGEIQDGNKRK